MSQNLAEPVVEAAPAATVTYEYPANTPKSSIIKFEKADVNGDAMLNIDEYAAFNANWLAKEKGGIDPVTWIPKQFKKKDRDQDGLWFVHTDEIAINRMRFYSIANSQNRLVGVIRAIV